MHLQPPVAQFVVRVFGVGGRRIIGSARLRPLAVGAAPHEPLRPFVASEVGELRMGKLKGHLARAAQSRLCAVGHRLPLRNTKVRLVPLLAKLESARKRAPLLADAAIGQARVLVARVANRVGGLAGLPERLCDVHPVVPDLVVPVDRRPARRRRRILCHLALALPLRLLLLTLAVRHALLQLLLLRLVEFGLLQPLRLVRAARRKALLALVARRVAKTKHH